MRAAVLCLFLFVAALVPTSGTAQVYQFATPPPQVTAAGADWQVQREPIFYAGSVYYPTGPNVFFDQRIMARTGTYKGVPLYADTTLDPYGIVYVPIGGNLLRPCTNGGAKARSRGRSATGCRRFPFSATASCRSRMDRRPNLRCRRRAPSSPRRSRKPHRQSFSRQSVRSRRTDR